LQKGINLFKEEKLYDALICYKQALVYDENFVEIYVARGAL
jgi:hypothetical protein